MTDDYGPGHIDGHSVGGPLDELPEAIKIMDHAEQVKLLEGVLKAAEEKQQAGDIAGGIIEVLKFAKGFILPV